MAKREGTSVGAENAMWEACQRLRNEEVGKKLWSFMKRTWSTARSELKRDDKHDSPEDRRARFAKAFISDTLWRLYQSTETGTLDISSADAEALFSNVLCRPRIFPEEAGQDLSPPERPWKLVVDVVEDTFLELTDAKVKDHSGIKTKKKNPPRRKPPGKFGPSPRPAPPAQDVPFWYRKLMGMDDVPPAPREDRWQRWDPKSGDASGSWSRWSRPDDLPRPSRRSRSNRGPSSARQVLIPPLRAESRPPGDWRSKSRTRGRRSRGRRRGGRGAEARRKERKAHRGYRGSRRGRKRSRESSPGPGPVRPSTKSEGRGKVSPSRSRKREASEASKQASSSEASSPRAAKSVSKAASKAASKASPEAEAEEEEAKSSSSSAAESEEEKEEKKQEDSENEEKEEKEEEEEEDEPEEPRICLTEAKDVQRKAPEDDDMFDDLDDVGLMAQLQGTLKEAEEQERSELPDRVDLESPEKAIELERCTSTSFSGDVCVNVAKGICLNKEAPRCKRLFDTARGGRFAGVFCQSCSQILECGWGEDQKNNKL